MQFLKTKYRLFFGRKSIKCYTLAAAIFGLICFTLKAPKCIFIQAGLRSLLDLLGELTEYPIPTTRLMKGLGKDENGGEVKGENSEKCK